MKFSIGIGRHSRFSFSVRDQWNKLVFAAGDYATESEAQLEALRYTELAQKASNSLGLTAAKRNTDKVRNQIRSMLV